LSFNPREIKRKISHIGNIFRVLTKLPPPKTDVFAGYDRIRQHYIIQQSVEHFSRRQDDPAPLLDKAVLDVGCGLSAVGEFMVLSGADVTALDTDPEIIAAAKQKAKKYGTEVTFIEGKIEDLVHTTQTYDVIVCLDLLEYLPNLNKFLWQVQRLLKPEGMLIFSAINKSPLAWVMHIFLSGWVYGRTPRGSRKFSRFYTPEHITNILTAQNFNHVTTQGLAYNTQEKRWQLSKKISTRYLGHAAAKSDYSCLS